MSKAKSVKDSKPEERAKIQADVDAFLKSGGKIEKFGNNPTPSKDDSAKK